MSLPHDLPPQLDADRLLSYLLRGGAPTLYEAEERFLDEALSEFLELLRGPITNEELSRHPFISLLIAHGSRGWEDSLL